VSRWRSLIVPVLLASGFIIRLWLTWKQGPTGDNQSFAHAANALREFGFEFYSHVNAEDRDYSYPPGYLPFLLAADWLSTTSFVFGLQFHQIIRLVPTAADIALAWIVQARLPAERHALRALAAGTIALGPSFVASSGLEAQLDSVAILPAVVAVLFWQKEIARRAVWCGLLIGIGVAIKTTPILVVLALLPTAVSVRESLRLLSATALVPAISLMPFVLVDWTGTSNTLEYAGYPGAGAISLLVQPSLGSHYLGDYDFSSAYLFPQQWGWLLTAGGLAITVALCLRSRLAPVQSAAILWLVVYATSINWFPQYLAWGLPFLLMSGFVLPIVTAELLLAPALLLTYAGGLVVWQPPAHWLGPLYTALLDILWCMAAAGAVVLLRRLVIAPRNDLGADRPPLSVAEIA
jgi:hypothetical protein